MSANERLATAQWILERTLGWIAAAEIKVGVVLSIDIAMMGGLAAAYAAATTKTPAIYGSTASAAAFAVAALACAAMSIKPRLDGPAQSLLYFGRVAELSRADYLARLKSASDEALLDDWAEQIHRNAEIAKVKHIWVTRSVVWSFLAAIPWAIAVSLLVR